jgi:hypothetical protein
MTASRCAPALSRLLFECRTTLGCSMLRSVRPSAHRYSVARLRSSFHPSSRSRCTKAAVHSSGLKAYSCPGTRWLDVSPAAAAGKRRAVARRSRRQAERECRAVSPAIPRGSASFGPSYAQPSSSPLAAARCTARSAAPPCGGLDPAGRAAAADTDARHRAAAQQMLRRLDDAVLASRKTYWESNGQITRRVRSGKAEHWSRKAAWAVGDSS